jgi:U3 small nucleolar RNA-associated protein 19
MVIPFTYNILKAHPALMVMIHSADVDDSNGLFIFASFLQRRSIKAPSLDPFLEDEPNPVQTNALDSSLWELLSHTSHYHAPVSTMCKIFSEAFTKPGYTMEDFLDHTYNTVSHFHLLVGDCV